MVSIRSICLTGAPHLILIFACSLFLCGYETIGVEPAEISNIDVLQLKPEVLYIDLANPSDARGIALVDEKQAANLATKELGGMPAVEPKDGYVAVKLDPAVVKEETPLLVAFSYYDSDRWDEPAIQGFLHRPDREGFYTTTATNAGAYADAWRWWTAFTYANYKSNFPPNAKQASFRLKVKGIRWILVLPLNKATIQQMNGIREKVLAMLADYSCLMVAEASLQDARNRMEQAMKYLPDDGKPASIKGVFDEVKEGHAQARIELDKVIMEVLSAIDPAYLGLFDGKLPERQEALAGFQEKVRGLTAHYSALRSKAGKSVDDEITIQNTKYELSPVVLSTPQKLSADRVIQKDDLRDRLFLGLVRQVPSLLLPQSSIENIANDQGIDSVCEYSLSNQVKLEENGTYDFSGLDKQLGTTKGLRVELGMHNIPLPDWIQKKFFGEKPEKLSSGRQYYDYYRIKAADGKWDGVCWPNPNGPVSFTPATDGVWSETLHDYALNFYRAMGKHYRDNPAILRYLVNSEASSEQVRNSGYKWDSALPYYQERLQKKFSDIQQLNQVFGTNYKDFAEVPLPKLVEGEKDVRLTPAYYEYIQLCIERTKYIRESYAVALKQVDPNHVIGECASGLYGGSVIDAYRMAVNTPYDTFAAGDSFTRAVRYTYSLNRYNPKPIWLYEPYTYSTWTAPEGKGYRVEESTRRMLTANLWTWFLWGHQGIPFFNQRSPDLRSDITDYRIADIMMGSAECGWQPQAANPTIRLAAGSLASLKPVYESLEKILLSAPVIPARIGLLESSTTQCVQWPTSGVFSDLGSLQGRLEQARKHFFFINETALTEGAEQMDSYRVIIAAYATHLRPEAREALLAWVKKGGILIGSGPTGLFDHYGRSEGGLPETVFGMKGVEYGAGLTVDSKVAKTAGTMSGREGISLWANKDFYWRLPAKDLPKDIQVLAALADGSPVAVERNYGKGKVILTATTIGGLLDLYWPMVMSEINNAQPVPEAASSSQDLTMQVRETAGGIRYLGLVNVNISTPVEATITVLGEFKYPRDLTVGKGWVIPATAGGGITKFKVWLGPGMGCFIELGKSLSKLTGLSPEEENIRLSIGRFLNLKRRAFAGGLPATNEDAGLKLIEKAIAEKKYEDAKKLLTDLNQSLSTRWFAMREEKITSKITGGSLSPAASVWAQSYAAIAQQLLKDGKTDSAEERMDYAEKILSMSPVLYPAEVVFPFISGRLDLKDFSNWPETGWQTVYKDQKVKSDELGQFILAGSPDGIYVGAKVRSGKITDKAQKSGLQWRVMDGVVVHLRGLDKTEELSNEWQSEDNYEITFYADGSVFVWENLLACDAKLIRCEVTRVKDGYWIGGFIPAPAVRFWPHTGVNILTDVCLFTYGQKNNTDGYWHGIYGQANTWARVRLGETGKEAKTTELTDSNAGLPATTAQPCLRTEYWMLQETRGVGRASVAIDKTEVLPNGKKGTIVLASDGQTEEVQLKTTFEEIGKKLGLRVWLKGSGSGAKIELRVTGREGYTWQKIIKDDVKGWRSVDIVLDKCQQTREDNQFEVLEGFTLYRPRLNSLIVRFSQPLSNIKVGLVEYLGK